MMYFNTLDYLEDMIRVVDKLRLKIWSYLHDDF